MIGFHGLHRGMDNHASILNIVHLVLLCKVSNWLGFHASVTKEWSRRCNFTGSFSSQPRWLLCNSHNVQWNIFVTNWLEKKLLRVWGLNMKIRDRFSYIVCVLRRMLWRKPFWNCLKMAFWGMFGTKWQPLTFF